MLAARFSCPGEGFSFSVDDSGFGTKVYQFMEFNRNNPVVKLCLQAMGLEQAGKSTEALPLYEQAWTQSENNFEKFLSAYYLAQYQETVSEQLDWLKTAVQLASEINDDAVKSAFPPLYTNIAKCYEIMSEPDMAKEYLGLVAAYSGKPTDQGPFYHGTRADLKVGELLVAGGNSNYQTDLRMNHIYFTALVNGAGLAAALAQGEGPERVYIVEPTGEFENDPNVTNMKFPGNPTRSYRSQAPLRIIGETTQWERITPEELRQWRERLANVKGEIIN